MPSRVKKWLIPLLILTWVLCSFEIWSEPEDLTVRQSQHYLDNGEIHDVDGKILETLEAQEVPC